MYLNTNIHLFCPLPMDFPQATALEFIFDLFESVRIKCIYAITCTSMVHNSEYQEREVVWCCSFNRYNPLIHSYEKQMLRTTAHTATSMNTILYYMYYGMYLVPSK